MSHQTVGPTQRDDAIKRRKAKEEGETETSRDRLQ